MYEIAYHVAFHRKTASDKIKECKISNHLGGKNRAEKLGEAFHRQRFKIIVTLTDVRKNITSCNNALDMAKIATFRAIVQSFAESVFSIIRNFSDNSTDSTRQLLNNQNSMYSAIIVHC